MARLLVVVAVVALASSGAWAFVQVAGFWTASPGYVNCTFVDTTIHHNVQWLHVTYLGSGSSPLPMTWTNIEDGTTLQNKTQVATIGSQPLTQPYTVNISGTFPQWGAGWYGFQYMGTSYSWNPQARDTIIVWLGTDSGSYYYWRCPGGGTIYEEPPGYEGGGGGYTGPGSEEFGGWFGSLIDGFAALVTAIVNGITTVCEAIASTTATIIQAIAQGFEGLLTWLEGAKTWFGDLFKPSDEAKAQLAAGWDSLIGEKSVQATLRNNWSPLTAGHEGWTGGDPGGGGALQSQSIRPQGVQALAEGEEGDGQFYESTEGGFGWAFFGGGCGTPPNGYYSVSTDCNPTSAANQIGAFGISAVPGCQGTTFGELRDLLRAVLGWFGGLWMCVGIWRTVNRMWG